jgi:hypothetical protein
MGYLRHEATGWYVGPYNELVDRVEATLFDSYDDAVYMCAGEYGIYMDEFAWEEF